MQIQLSGVLGEAELQGPVYQEAGEDTEIEFQGISFPSRGPGKHKIRRANQQNRCWEGSVDIGFLSLYPISLFSGGYPLSELAE